VITFGKLLEFRPIKNFLIRLLINSVAKELSHLGTNRIVFYDIGSRWGIWPRAKAIPLPIYSIGVDADPIEAQRLEAVGAFSRVIPRALSDSNGLRTLYVAKEPGQSSLRPPDFEVIGRHCTTANHEIVKEIPLDACTLDEAIQEYQLPPPDFIKFDVEGSDIDIIQASISTLQTSCCGLFFEARLAPFYQGEKLLGDGLQFLTANGFSPLQIDSVGSFNGAHLLFDCGLVPNPRTRTTALSTNQLLKACLFSLVLENWGYSRFLIEQIAVTHQFNNSLLKTLSKRWSAHLPKKEPL